MQKSCINAADLDLEISIYVRDSLIKVIVEFGEHRLNVYKSNPN